MFALSVPELLAIRENQVLRMALALCGAPPSRRPVRGAAFEIVTQNLILHGYPDIACNWQEPRPPGRGPTGRRRRARPARGANQDDLAGLRRGDGSRRPVRVSVPRIFPHAPALL